MNGYHMVVSCPTCGGALCHDNAAIDADGLYGIAVTHCEACGVEWRISVSLRTRRRDTCAQIPTRTNRRNSQGERVYA